MVDTINYEIYNKRMYEVEYKAALEIGVEINVFCLLENIFFQNNSNLTVVDVNNMKQGADERFIGVGGIPDIAIVSNDFVYKKNQGKCYGCVEVKVASEYELQSSSQLVGHILSFGKVLYTNGYKWEYYDLKSFYSKKQGEIDVIKEKNKQDKTFGQKERGKIREEIANMKVVTPVRSIDLKSKADTKESKCLIDEEKYKKLLEKLKHIDWENEG